jgi:uncharacterized protein
LYIQIRYEWDERKNRENQRKHSGISFELAALVFEDMNCLIRMDRIDESGEQRWHAIGSVSPLRGVSAVLVVVHLYRHPGSQNEPFGISGEDDSDEETIRIISARKAGPNEIRRYQEQKVD